MPATDYTEPADTALEVAPPLELDRETRGIIGEMVATANRYPRSVEKFMKEATALVTLDEETAEACIYALPRDGKTIEGPSARFAEIIANCWRNLRIDARVVGDDGKLITSRGSAWDMERNVLIAYEVSRRVTGRNGRRYSDDMITVTGNAASSIALRNAVLKAIPAALWKPLYHKAKEAAVGTTETLVSRRTKMLAYFQKLGAPAAKVFEVLGIGGEADLTLEHLGTLRGWATAIKEGDTTLDEAFADAGQAPIKTPERKSASTAPATAAPSTPSPAPEASTAAPSPSPTPAAATPLTIIALIPQKRPGSTRICWKVALSDESSAYFWDDQALMKAAHGAKELGVPVALTYTGQGFGGAKEISGVTPVEG